MPTGGRGGVSKVRWSLSPDKGEASRSRGAATSSRTRALKLSGRDDNDDNDDDNNDDGDGDDGNHGGVLAPLLRLSGGPSVQDADGEGDSASGDVGVEGSRHEQGPRKVASLATRLWIVATFFFMSCLQSMCWNIFSPIFGTVTVVYDWTASEVEWLENGANVAM